MITPPYHFSTVAAPIGPEVESSQILYRGSIPAARNASFLRRLGIRTLIYLRKKEYKQDDPLVVWAGKQCIDLRWVKAEKMEEEALGMEPEHVTDVLKVRPASSRSDCRSCSTRLRTQSTLPTPTVFHTPR